MVFLVLVPSGDAVVVVLLVSLSPISTYRIHYGLLTGTSPTITRPPSKGLSFSLSYSLFSLNCSMYVCVEMIRYDFVYYKCCDVKVLICGDDKRVYVFCWNDIESKMILYSFLTLDWHALIGLVH
jgi:hypothetical protein